MKNYFSFKIFKKTKKGKRLAGWHNDRKEKEGGEGRGGGGRRGGGEGGREGGRRGRREGGGEREKD